MPLYFSVPRKNDDNKKKKKAQHVLPSEVSSQQLSKEAFHHSKTSPCERVTTE